MTDLQAKYQKLAAEYAKLRAQVPVLKKAVLDEQANEEQLKLTVKEKDQAIRKYEQEIDSLIFRNNQLSTRVGILQQELEEVLTQGKKHKKNVVGLTLDSHVGEANASIINEELRSKIEENARLHKQVYESEHEYREELSHLNQQLASLKSEASQHESVLSSLKAASAEKISRLQEEKTMLEVKVQLQEKDAKLAIQHTTELEEQLRKTTDELTSKLKELSLVVDQKVLFNDTRDQAMNALNVPRHDHRHHLQARELLTQANMLVQDLVPALEAFYTHSEARIRIFADAVGEPLSDVNNKYCQHLRVSSAILQSVKQSYTLFHDSITDDSLILLEALPRLQGFASSWNAFVSYAHKLLPYQLLSIEEECGLSSCPTTLATKNMELHASLQRFFAMLSRVDTYISLLATQSDASFSYPATNHPKMFELLSQTVKDFSDAVKALSRCFNAKVALEHQLPTATQKLKVTDECILASLVSLVTGTTKISAFISGNLNFFTHSPHAHCHGKPTSTGVVTVVANPAVSFLRQRAVNYLASIYRPPVESVPYETALQNQKMVYSFTESKDSLTQQVVNLQDKLTRLEQEREHWILETQLMQMKYEKAAQKLQSLQKTDNVLLDTAAATSGSVPVQRLQPEGAATSILGQIEVLETSRQHGGDVVEAELREQMITKHYSGRISELMSQLQHADSKALHFLAECRALQKRLGVSQRDRDKLQQEVSAANQCITQLKDELQTTTRSYEGQLSMMSEHLAGMNERLTEQKDEIDMLRYQLQQQQLHQNVKPNKKGKLGR